MAELVNPGMIVSKVVFTKKIAQTFSGYGISCKIEFYQGPSISYDIEHHIDLFEDSYQIGIYEWDGKEFIQIEN